MKRQQITPIFFLLPALMLFQAGFAFAQSSYFPPAGAWERRSPEQAGFEAAKLKEAVDFAIANEAKAPRSQELGQAQTFGREPFGEAIGLFKDRGDATGLIISGGRIVAEWGSPDRVDMSHSVTKSFLSSVVGLAFDRRLIRSLQDRAADYSAVTLPYVPGQRFDRAEEFGKQKYIDLFAGPHNSKITWEHLLRQTSDWEGTLWGKPDWADRPDRDATTWLTRRRNEPGAVYEYNDVRVNASHSGRSTFGVGRCPRFCVRT